MSFFGSLIGSFLATSAIDVVGVYTPDFTQVFPQGRPIKVSIKEESKLMEHPLETGAVSTDHSIILPVEIELSLILQAADYRDTYQIIKQLYLDKTTLLVQTRTAVYENQIIMSMPHEETAELYDAIAIALKLKEILFVAAQYDIAPKRPRNSSTVDRGTQQSKDVPPQRASLLHGFFN